MKKFIVVLTCCLFLVAVVRPVPVEAAQDYSLPAGANVNTYLSLTYRTFGDFLNFAVYNGLNNFTYDYSSGSGKINIYYQVDGNTLARVSYEGFSVSHASLEATSYALYSGNKGGNALIDLFVQFYADYPNITQYSAVQDSIGHFKVVLFLLVGFMFIMAGRRSVS